VEIAAAAALEMNGGAGETNGRRWRWRRRRGRRTAALGRRTGGAGRWRRRSLLDEDEDKGNCPDPGRLGLI